MRPFDAMRRRREDRRAEAQRQQEAAWMAFWALMAQGMGLKSCPPPPGPCWHDSGITWPDGFRPRCELLAGHDGAHQCDRGSKGGTAVWTVTIPAAPTTEAPA